MCVALPGRVTAIDATGAQVIVRGRTRTASTLLFDDVEVGDYVLVSQGTIVDRIDEVEATVRLEMFDQLLEVLDDTR
jgi:hydrogenase assembly chaperone HypC/HupF